eukprot:935344_1
MFVHARSSLKHTVLLGRHQTIKNIVCIDIYCAKFYSSIGIQEMNRNIVKLCKREGVLKAWDRIINSNSHSMTLSDDTLNILLCGCGKRNSGKHTIDMTHKIWNTLVHQHGISPSIQSYCSMMHVLAKNGDHKPHIYKLIGELKHRYDCDDFNDRDWWFVIDTFGLLRDGNNMLHEYNTLVREYPNIKLNKYILSSVLQGLIRAQQTQVVATIWQDVKKEEHMFNSLVLQSFIVCIDKCSHDPLLTEVWNVIVQQCGIKPDFGCYCAAFLAFSRNTSESCHPYVHDIMRHIHKHLDKQSFKVSGVHLRQILTAHGNLGQLDEMWTKYHQYIALQNSNKHDVSGLNVLLSKETRTAKTKDILNIISNELCTANVSIDYLMSFHRVACSSHNEQENADKIWNAIQRLDKQKTNVISTFYLADIRYEIESGYVKNCPFNGVHKVELLMDQIGYEMDLSNVAELDTNEAKHKLLKSHSEKKALAILILSNQTDINIAISSGIKMCKDCHKFFKSVSRVYDKINIQCTDQRGTHLFKNGHCLLCHK